MPGVSYKSRAPMANGAAAKSKLKQPPRRQPTELPKFLFDIFVYLVGKQIQNERHRRDVEGEDNLSYRLWRRKLHSNVRARIFSFGMHKEAVVHRNPTMRLAILL